ncbi:MAG: hypothetical protein INR73_04175 [Williamsia sp.]|nr:hypothetical protein [Williamsia sp.]
MHVFTLRYKPPVIGNSLKAALAIFLFLCAILCLLMFWGLQVFHLPFYIPLVIFCLPFIIFSGYLLRNCTVDTPMNNIAYCRMNYLFPFHFTRDHQHARSEQIDLDSMKKQLQDGDIVLRRYNDHLDGLIFKQNSYFTHAGICERVPRAGRDEEEQQFDYYVWHATAGENVHRITLEQFCNCDEVAVFRLCPEQFPKSKKFKKAANHFRKHGQGYKSQFTRTEQDIYTALFEEVSSGGKMADLDLDWELYRTTVVQKARQLEGTQYDKTGNFTNPSKLCCIEYVWLCYLCLFPLHIIRLRNFRYFNMVEVLSLIPDVFIKNKYFACKYTSLEHIRDRKELIRFTNKHRVSFAWFMARMFLWEFLFLCMIFLINGLSKGIYLSWF